MESSWRFPWVHGRQAAARLRRSALPVLMSQDDGLSRRTRRSRWRVLRHRIHPCLLRPVCPAALFHLCVPLGGRGAESRVHGDGSTRSLRITTRSDLGTTGRGRATPCGPQGLCGGAWRPDAACSHFDPPAAGPVRRHPPCCRTAGGGGRGVPHRCTCPLRLNKRGVSHLHGHRKQGNRQEAASQGDVGSGGEPIVARKQRRPRKAGHILAKAKIRLMASLDRALARHCRVAALAC